jgi:hypothetical protein
MRLLADVRVGLTMNALPVVLPVQFAVLDGDVVFQTVEVTRVHVGAAEAVVAFEADGYFADGSSGSSVLVQGRCRVLTHPLEVAEAQGLFPLCGRARQKKVGRGPSTAK